MGEQDAAVSTARSSGEEKTGVHLRILEPRLELGQLGPPFLAQGQVGAAANVAAVPGCRRSGRGGSDAA